MKTVKSFFLLIFLFNCMFALDSFKDSDKDACLVKQKGYVTEWLNLLCIFLKKDTTKKTESQHFLLVLPQ